MVLRRSIAVTSIGILFAGALAANTSQSELNDLQDQLQHLSKEDRKGEQERNAHSEMMEAHAEVSLMEANVRSDHHKVSKALANLKNFRASLSDDSNSTHARAQAKKLAQDARDASKQKRQELHDSFDTARTAAHEASANSNKTEARALMGHQVQLMARSIKGLHKLDHKEQHTAHHNLNKIRSHMHHKAKQLHKEARNAVDHLRRSAHKLERAQHKAKLSEHERESTQEQNEYNIEHAEDELDDIAGDIQDRIEDVGERIEDPLEQEMETAHHENRADIEELQNQQRAVSEMADDAADRRKNGAHSGMSLMSEPHKWFHVQAVSLVALPAISFSLTALLFFAYSRLRVWQRIGTRDGGYSVMV